MTSKPSSAKPETVRRHGGHAGSPGPRQQGNQVKEAKTRALPLDPIKGVAFEIHLWGLGVKGAYSGVCNSAIGPPSRPNLIDRFQGPRPWRVQGSALVSLPSPDFPLPRRAWGVAITRRILYSGIKNDRERSHI
jgi:hypothetical protein